MNDIVNYLKRGGAIAFGVVALVIYAIEKLDILMLSVGIFGIVALVLAILDVLEKKAPAPTATVGIILGVLAILLGFEVIVIF